METTDRRRTADVMIVPGATVGNAQRYVLGAAIAGALVIAAVSIEPHDSERANLLLAVSLVGLVAFFCCGVPLYVGVYRRANAMRAAGEGFDRASKAVKRQQLQNFAGVLMLFTAVALQSSHAFFGAREFSGQSALELFLILGGVLVQMYSQAVYLKALG